jgi:tRNA (Thr-GGU) A37 N-methylase
VRNVTPDRLKVSPLEAIDGTAIVDITPVLRRVGEA